MTSEATTQKPAFRPTLNFIFVTTVCGLAILLAVLFLLYYSGSRDAIIDSADQLRELASRQIESRIEHFFQRAGDSLTAIERQLMLRSIAYAKPTDLEPALFAEMINDPQITSISFTYAISKRSTPDGELELEPGGRGELSVARVFDSARSRLVTRHVHQGSGGEFVSEVRNRAVEDTFESPPFTVETGARPVDPTIQRTFTTTIQRNFKGRAIWTDLYIASQSQGETADPSRARVCVQKAIVDSSGRFLGVLRVAISTDELDAIVKSGVTGDDKPDPHQVFLCDDAGRMVTRLRPDDTLHPYPDVGYRFESREVPEPIAAALKLDALGKMNKTDHPTGQDSFYINGERYLVTFRSLQSTQDWIIGIVVPERAYLQGLLQSRTRLLGYALAVIVCILLGGIFTIRIVKRDLSTIERETGRMRNFEFDPSRAEPAIEDVHQVMDRLELAKTAMRSMSKYVPVALVRKLYAMRAEPVLSSELCDTSIMFTDIKDFTTISEQLTPDQLARALGRYLQAMTDAIQGRQGTIDKFIGDAVMTLWNVPVPVANHPQQACQAALDCKRSLEQLFASPEWKDLPRFDTRFGLHKDSVMVGHFGAPDRMSYTAMGDGVNVASRLEGLNKLYGTSILVSEVIQSEAGGAFAFRLIDIVAVKGRKKGLKIYELLGAAGTPLTGAIAGYEKAFEHYLRREFDAAISILESHAGDAPGAALLERCREMKSNPPPPDWEGVHVAKTK
jgi:adenylate cyclase